MQLGKDRTGIEKKFFELASQAVGSLGFQLYDMDYISGAHLLRLYIMNPQTKSAVLDDCVTVDRAMTPHLEQDWVPQELTLEVSSPGVYRHLRTREHFQMALGERLQLALKEPLVFKGPKDKEIKRQKVVGFLKSFDDTGIRLGLVPEDSEHEIKFEIIKKATLDPDLEATTAL